MRAAVCESDWTVGARTTSAARIAAATGGGGSAAWESRWAIRASTRIGPRPSGLAAQALPEPERRRIGDHEHVLARGHPEAVVDDGGDGAFEVGPIRHRGDPNGVA